MIAVCTTCTATFDRRPGETWKRKCLSCWLATKSGGSAMQVQARVAAPIPAEKLRGLIFLTHPDKHGGSRLATELTAWLLELRRASRSATP